MKPAVSATVRLVLLCLVSRLACAQTGPLLVAADAAVVEGNSGRTNLVFHLSLSQSSAKTVMVDYATRDRTAHCDSDYWETFGVAIFPPGTTNTDVIVFVKGDELNEPDETFWLMLAHPVHARLLQDHAVGTILNDDPPPTLSINDVALAEGRQGTTKAVFIVRLSAASGRTVTVDCLTANGTASAGAEFIPVADTLTFVPGATMQTLVVPVNGGALTRSEGTFSVILTNAVNAIIDRPLGTATVMSDRPMLALPRNAGAASLIAANEGATEKMAPRGGEAPDGGAAATASARSLPAAPETKTTSLAGAAPSVADAPSAGLSLSVADLPKFVHVERRLTIALAVTNSSINAAHNVTVTNWLPPSATFLSAQAEQGNYTRTKDVVVFSLGESPGGASARAAITLKFSAAGLATNLVQLGSTGGDILVANVSAAQVILSVNDPPILSPIPDQVTRENTPTLPIPFTVTDAETPAAELIVLGSSSDPNLVPDENLVLGGTTSHRMLTVVPVANRTGAAVVTMTVTDSAGAETSQAFTVTVLPPAAEILNIELVELLPESPVFERVEHAGDLLNLYFSVEPGLAYSVEYSDSLVPAAWQTLKNIEAAPARAIQVVSDAVEDHAQRFYRLNATPQPGLFQAPARVDLHFTASAARSYAVEYCDELAAGSWQTLTNVGPFASSSQVTISDPDSGQPQRFYRLRSQ